MSGTISRDWARFEPFDPNEGTVIRSAPGEGAGWWVGAPAVLYDQVTAAFYLAYRIRRPRGVHPDRGAEVHIARSTDGVEFEDIWVGRKETLDSTSIERCALTRLPDGRWGFFVSFVDPADGRWRIDLVEADQIDQLNLAHRRPVLTAGDIGAEGVKDPFLFRVAGLYHMIVSFATAAQPAAPDELHGTHDAYNTGLIKSRTGLATSRNGRDWSWEGELIGPSADGWDRYCTRIGTLWPQDGVWLALYDGSADVSENYEERVGLAYSLDLRRFVRVTRDGPLMVQPNASGALRYFDVLRQGDQTFFYYETACPDGSHDLRVFRRTART
ncbi:MAG: hypothetical protein GXP27_22825 [Planctomycetes bacterium]|nr:hypothetical protein [Planctomycetota bacterium]